MNYFRLAFITVALCSVSDTAAFAVNDRVNKCVMDYSEKLVESPNTAQAISNYIAEKCLELSDVPPCHYIIPGRCAAVDVEVDNQIRALTVDLAFQIISDWRRSKK